jgi:hypothetical protein
MAGTTALFQNADMTDTMVPDNESLDAILLNPFRGKRPAEMNELIREFLERTQLHDIYHGFIRKGAFLAQDRHAFDERRRRDDDLSLDQEEIDALRREDPATGNKWDQPWRLYALVACCSIGAATQGWDGTSVNGGEYQLQFQ